MIRGINVLYLVNVKVTQVHSCYVRSPEVTVSSISFRRVQRGEDSLLITLVLITSSPSLSLLPKLSRSLQVLSLSELNVLMREGMGSMSRILISFFSCGALVLWSPRPWLGRERPIPYIADCPVKVLEEDQRHKW